MANTFTFNDSWNITLMRMAQEMSARSKDTSTKVGAVVISPTGEVLSTGYNGFPRKVNDNVPTRQVRPTKYDFVVHAEVNALLNAGRNDRARVVKRYEKMFDEAGVAYKTMSKDGLMTTEEIWQLAKILQNTK